MREEGTDEDNPPLVTYKETLVGDSQHREDGIGGRDADWDFEEGDVIESHEGVMPSIKFSARIQEKLIQPWKNSVVVKLLGRTIGYKALCARLASMWKPSMGYSVIDLENNYFLVRFRNAGDALDALTRGPWIILVTDFEYVNVWIRLPGLGLHLYHQKTLNKIGQLVGEVIKLDDNIESSTRGKFARVVVRISLAKPLVSQVELNGRIQKIEYEGLPVICFKCGRYGHNSGECSANMKNGQPGGEEISGKDSQQGEVHIVQENGKAEDNHFEPFGPWMVAYRRGRKPASGKETVGEPKRNRLSQENTTSRFQVLDKIYEETVNRENPETAVAPDIYLQFQATTSKTNHETIPAKAKPSKSVIRREQRKKAAAIKQNLPEAFPATKPSQIADISFDPSTSHKNDVSNIPHANPNFIPCLFTHGKPTGHITTTAPTTLDPTNHTVVFCTPQQSIPVQHNFANNTMADEELQEIQNPHYPHLHDPPDAMDGFDDGGVDSIPREPAVTEADATKEAMSEGDESMVEETPGACIQQAHGQ
ncbi:reverse transcriptase domain-containing protein [Citrus sinensis]|uniref:Reverse transcriptase domain-containing protein n=1 Tax=Citrus sinensis TaxID=2711 RepID=A0ACB8JV16_CITSI|nr:reverse transcriptase domain-containing protein [Citrus sinensis]